MSADSFIQRKQIIKNKDKRWRKANNVYSGSTGCNRQHDASTVTSMPMLTSLATVCQCRWLSHWSIRS